MNKYGKKLIITLLTAVFIITAASACSSKTTPTPAPEQVESTAPSSDPTNMPEPSEAVTDRPGGGHEPSYTEEAETEAPPTEENSEEPKQEPEPTADPMANMDSNEKAQFVLEQMTLEEKVGQMFFLAFRNDASGNPITELTPEVEKVIKNIGPGGIILFSENIQDEQQTKDLVSGFRKASKYPVFIGIDEEGGEVIRTSKLNYRSIPSADQMGKAGANSTRSYASDIGRYLKPLGINLDFAPVADINTNPGGNALGSRTFGTAPGIVSEMAGAFIDGLHSEGIYACAKHFPGLGGVSGDSHDDFIKLDHDMDRLRGVELAPFQAAIDDGVEFVMVGHISVPKITLSNIPASLSSYMIKTVLRGEMGFKGIAITDAMNMGAIVKHYEPGEAVIKAVNAGMDMILMPEDVQKAYDELLLAVKLAQVDVETINESVLRILEVKYR